MPTAKVIMRASLRLEAKFGPSEDLRKARGQAAMAKDHLPSARAHYNAACKRLLDANLLTPRQLRQIESVEGEQAAPKSAPVKTG